MIRSEVDFEAEGSHTGFLRLAHSTHHSAYGWIPIPVVSIRNGAGPTVLVMAGNHGDEYEGQVLAAQLIRRCSLVVDLHSGGSSLLYNGPTMMALEPRDAQEAERVRSLLSAFGLPRAFLHAPNPVTISSAARRQGAVSIVTELGGAGMVSAAILRAATQGLLHLLAHVGVLQGALVPGAPPSATRFMRIDAAVHYVYASENGLFEPLVELGESVAAGQAVARIHFPETPWRLPETVHASGAGEIICKRVPAMSRRGDCLFQLAQDHVEA